VVTAAEISAQTNPAKAEIETITNSKPNREKNELVIGCAHITHRKCASQFQDVSA
jgi:hypothetical protein